MAKSFTKLYSDFWINPNNAELMQLGTDAKLMAIYLQGNAHQNMLGVYYLPILYIASDLKQSVRKVQNALKELCGISYCRYDEQTQYIWICNMALEQLGEDIDAKDNRIKAVQAIWDNLPVKIEFLSEVYNKYHSIFNLKSRLSHYNLPEIKSVETQRNIEAPLDTNNYVNLNLDKKSGRYEKDSIANHCKLIYPAIDLSSGFSSYITSHFEGVVAKKSLQSPSIPRNGYGCAYDYDFDKTNLPIALLSLPKKEEMAQKDYLYNTARSNTFGYTDSNTQDLVDFADRAENTNREVTSCSLEGAVHFFNSFGDPSKDTSNSFSTPSKVLTYPLQAPLKGIQSPSEAPSEALRSNIEYRSKNIEEINKKKKEEVEKRKDLYKNNAPIPNIVAFKQQTRPCVNGKSTDKNYLSSKKTKKEKAKSRIDDSVAAVFDHWKSVMLHPKSKLDQKRKILIHKALQIGYSFQELCDAITGCSLTPHNMGDNKQGERYDGLHVILKDADQIDRFIHNFHHPPQKENKAQKRLRENFCMAKEWAERKTGNTTGSK